MKTKKTIIYSFIASLIISFAFFSCTNDDPGNIQYGEVEFGFDLKEISPNKSIQADFGDPSAIVLSIEDASGTLVYDTEEVELYNMNGSFVSKPLSLLVGDYKLVTFMVIDVDANVIYASPLVGSNMAYLVNNPVPINFTVNKDQTVKLIPEVLSTEDVTPEDFGYTTFGFDVVETFDFLISVFAYNETSENFELTDAILSVYADDNPIFRDSLQAITNQVKVNDGFDPYIVEVRKDGYDTYLDTIENAELKLYFNSEDNGPLIVILENGTPATGQPCPGAPTVTDADGNVYPTVQIGNQCWMAANLNVGNQINSSVNQSDNGVIEKFCYDNDPINCDTYGGLYQWNEMMEYSDTVPGIQGICPDGWHIPNPEEVYELYQNYDPSFHSLYSGWFINGGFYFIGQETNLWTNAMTANTAEGFSGQGVTQGIHFWWPNNNDIVKNYGLSVRCIKN